MQCNAIDATQSTTKQHYTTFCKTRKRNIMLSKLVLPHQESSRANTQPPGQPYYQACLPTYLLPTTLQCNAMQQLQRKASQNSTTLHSAGTGTGILCLVSQCYHTSRAAEPTPNQQANLTTKQTYLPTYLPTTYGNAMRCNSYNTKHHKTAPHYILRGILCLVS